MTITLTPRATLSIVLIASCLPVAPGCALKQAAWESDAWVNGYESAEKRASERETGMVICYRDTAPNRPDKMIEATRDAIVEDSKSDYVGSVLAKSHAWDRKYVAQFGVDRSPAIVVLHPDGTYHAHVGFLDATGVKDFLASANPPGNAPKWNPYLHREPRYTWLGSIDEAKTIARDLNRSMLIVFHRPWSDDMHRLNQMLKKPAAYRRFSQMVHVRSGSPWSFSEVAETAYGTLHLPAIVIVTPDGSYRVLENPSGYEAIIHFADNTEPNHESHATTTTPATTALGSQ